MTGTDSGLSVYGLAVQRTPENSVQQGLLPKPPPSLRPCPSLQCVPITEPDRRSLP
jgi:hypothetical protein